MSTYTTILDNVIWVMLVCHAECINAGKFKGKINDMANYFVKYIRLMTIHCNDYDCIL